MRYVATINGAVKRINNVNNGNTVNTVQPQGVVHLLLPSDVLPGCEKC